MLSLDIAAKRRRKRSDYHYFLDYRLRWADNDIFGHMNNPYYGVLIDSVANQFLIDECGYKPSQPPHAAIIVNTYCDYFGSVSYPGEVEAGLRVAKLGKTSVVYEVGIFGKGEENVKAVGGSMHVWVDMGADGTLGRPLVDGMPAAARKGYERLLEGGEKVNSKL